MIADNGLATGGIYLSCLCGRVDLGPRYGAASLMDRL